jgi:hypothetical protein
MTKMSDTITRTYKGTDHVVTPTDDGKFEYNGTVFKSLTAIAQEITGQKAISGPRFFQAAEAKGAGRGKRAATPKQLVKGCGVILDSLIVKLNGIEDAELKRKVGNKIIARITTEVGTDDSDDSTALDA